MARTETSVTEDGEPAPGPAPAPLPERRPRARAVLDRWAPVRDAFVGARFELPWMAFGLALLGLSAFNRHHGLVLSTQLPYLGLDLAFLFIAAGAFLRLTRGKAPPAGTGPDWWARTGAALFVFGVGAEILSTTTGAFSSLMAGGLFLPDLALLAGGFTFAWRASRVALPHGTIWQASLAALVLGTAATLVHNGLAALPFHQAYRAYLEGGGEALASAGALVHPMTPAVSGTQGAAHLLRLLRAGGAGAVPNEVLAWLGNLALLGLAGIVWSAMRRAPATAAGERKWVHAGIVLAAGALLYLPTLGGYALYDPWEGHYAEVARQMVVRDDWVSLYWYDNWFWSKPVGIFWMMAGTFKVLGVSDVAARLPFALTGIAGMYFVYYFCRKLWSARAGVLAAVVLGCFPQYLFISRQVMTDIPVTVLTTMGIGLLVLALLAKDEDEIERLPLTVLFFAVFAGMTLPQFGMFASELERFGLVHALVYLLLWLGLFLALARARKARQIYAYGFYLCVGIGCLAKGFLAPGLPALALIVYLVCTGEWGDFFSLRRAGVGLGAGLGAFGIAAILIKAVYKIPGDGLLLSAAIGAAAVALITLAATARGGVWERLELRKGLLIFALTGLPWYIAMAARHGGVQLDANAPFGMKLTGFLQEFIVQHHFDRLGGGVHGDTNTTFEYFVRWGAYAMFPLVALLPGALARFWRGSSDLGLARPGRAKLFVFLWATAFFTLFAMSATKFHHYILPVLPPLAILIGVWLDRAAEDETEITHGALAAGIALLLFVGMDLIKVPQTLYNSFTYVFSGRTYPWPTQVMPEPFLKLCFLTAGAVLFFGLLPRPGEAQRRRIAWACALAFAGLLLAAILFKASPVAPKLMSVARERMNDYREALAQVMPIPPAAMMQEYVQFLPADRLWYYIGKLTGRLGDYGFGLLGGFGAVIALAALYATGRRRLAVWMFLGVSFVFGLWCAHRYMNDLGVHSGQRHVFDVYYQKRAGPEERFCAYMMNWRTEHWYTNNEVWVALNDQRLLEHARRPGRQWVVTERTRVNDMKNLLNVRNAICRKVVEWDNWSNRYTLVTLEDDPQDTQVAECLRRRGGR